jgi:hypothetical protein
MQKRSKLFGLMAFGFFATAVNAQKVNFTEFDPATVF